MSGVCRAVCGADWRMCRCGRGRKEWGPTDFYARGAELAEGWAVSFFGCSIFTSVGGPCKRGVTYVYVAFIFMCSLSGAIGAPGYQKLGPRATAPRTSDRMPQQFSVVVPVLI